MGDVNHGVGGSSSERLTVLQSAARAAECVDTSISPNIVKGVLSATSFVSLLFGFRSAWKHTRQPEAAVLVRAQVFSGVGFASKALAIATVITVSGFSLFVVGISWALSVNTPQQFGRAMRASFGDRFRLPQSQNSQSFDDILRSIEARTPSTVERSTPQK